MRINKTLRREPTRAVEGASQYMFEGVKILLELNIEASTMTRIDDQLEIKITNNDEELIITTCWPTQNGEITLSDILLGVVGSWCAHEEIKDLGLNGSHEFKDRWMRSATPNRGEYPAFLEPAYQMSLSRARTWRAFVTHNVETHAIEAVHSTGYRFTPPYN